MASISEFKLLLYNIKTQLLAHPIFIRGKGVPIDDPAYFRENAELNRLNIQLSLLLRDTKNTSYLLSAQGGRLRSLPQTARYQAAASLASKQAEIFEVLKLGTEIKGLIEELIGRSFSVSGGEALHGVAETIEGLYHHAHEHGETTIMMGDDLSYISASRTDFGGGIEAVMIAVFVGVQAFLHRSRKAAARDLPKKGAP